MPESPYKGKLIVHQISNREDISNSISSCLNKTVHKLSNHTSCQSHSRDDITKYITSDLNKAELHTSLK